MKRTLLVAAAALLLSPLLPHSAWAFGVKDVVTMHQDGIPDSLIVAKIQHSNTTFQLDARDFRALKEAGVSNDIVLAMLRTEDRRDGDGVRVLPSWYLGLDFYPYGPYYHAYVPFYVRGGYGYWRRGFPGRRFRRF